MADESFIVGFEAETAGAVPKEMGRIRSAGAKTQGAISGLRGAIASLGLVSPYNRPQRQT